MPEVTLGNPAPLAVEARRLCKAYGEGEARVEALRGVDVAVREGEFVAVMGPSGSGKSTLLHLVGGLDRPDSGEVRIGNESLSDLDDDRLTALRRRRIGFVFQAFNLLPVLTALENVALPLEIDGVAPTEANRRARECLARVGVEGRADHVPSGMSGGEQQRVAVARALAIRPVLLLADEPTGNLDSANGRQVMALLRGLADGEGHAVLMVTHDPRAAALADRIVWLGDGLVVEEQRLTPGHALEEIVRRLEREP